MLYFSFDSVNGFSGFINVFKMTYREKQLKRIELIYGKNSKEYKNIKLLMDKFNSTIDVIKPTS